MTRRERAMARALRTYDSEERVFAVPFMGEAIDAYEAGITSDLEDDVAVERARRAFYYFGDGTETTELSANGRMRRALQAFLGETL